MKYDTLLLNLQERLEIGTTPLNKKALDLVIKGFTKEIILALQQGDFVAIPSFGKFMILERAARKINNPRAAGQKIDVPACKAVKFSAAKNFKEELNGEA